MLWFYEYESIHLKMICLGFFSRFSISEKKNHFESFSICFVVIWHLNDYISNTFISNIHHFDYIFLVQVLHLNQSVWSVCERYLMAKINILFQFWYSWCFDRFTNISSFFGRSVKKLKNKICQYHRNSIDSNIKAKDRTWWPKIIERVIEREKQPDVDAHQMNSFNVLTLSFSDRTMIEVS